MIKLLFVLLISVNTVSCGRDEDEQKKEDIYENPEVGCWEGCYSNGEPENVLTRLYARLRFLDRLNLNGESTKAYVQIGEKGVGEKEFTEYLEKQIDITDYQTVNQGSNYSQDIFSSYALRSPHYCANDYSVSTANTEEFGIISDYQPNGRALFANIILPDYRSQYSLSFWIDVDGDGKLSDGDFVQKEAKTFYHNVKDPDKFDFEMVEYKEEVVIENIILKLEILKDLEEMSGDTMVLVYLQNQVSEWIGVEILLSDVLEADGHLILEEQDVQFDRFKIVIDVNGNLAEDELDWVSDWTVLDQTAVLEQL